MSVAVSALAEVQFAQTVAPYRAPSTCDTRRVHHTELPAGQTLPWAREWLSGWTTPLRVASRQKQHAGVDVVPGYTNQRRCATKTDPERPHP